MSRCTYYFFFDAKLTRPFQCVLLFLCELSSQIRGSLLTWALFVTKAPFKRRTFKFVLPSCTSKTGVVLRFSIIYRGLDTSFVGSSHHGSVLGGVRFGHSFPSRKLDRLQYSNSCLEVSVRRPSCPGENHLFTAIVFRKIRRF